MSKPRGQTSTFYTKAEEVRSGYLHKSPPSSLLRSKMSWTRRFFALLKTDEGVHMLKYFKSEEMDKPLGEIELSEISMLIFCPETHNMWGWIHKNFRCPTACVLLLRATGRDYFLIGENSWETDEWFKALYKLLKSRSDMVSHEDMNVVKPRATSAPPAPWTDKTYQDNNREAKSMSLQLPPSHLPTGISHASFTLQPPYPDFLLQDTGPSVTEEDIYAVPNNRPVKAPPQNEEKDEGVDGSVEYMYEDMATLLGKETKTEDKVPSENVDSEDSDFNDDSGDETRTKDSPSFKDAITDERQASVHRLSTAIEMDVCVSPEDLKKHLNMTANVETTGKRDSLLFKGDEILAVNNLHVESVEEVKFYLRKLRTNKVTLTIQRLSNEFEALRTSIEDST